MTSRRRIGTIQRVEEDSLESICDIKSGMGYNTKRTTTDIDLSGLNQDRTLNSNNIYTLNTPKGNIYNSKVDQVLEQNEETNSNSKPQLSST